MQIKIKNQWTHQKLPQICWTHLLLVAQGKEVQHGVKVYCLDHWIHWKTVILVMRRKIRKTGHEEIAQGEIVIMGITGMKRAIRKTGHDEVVQDEKVIVEITETPMNPQGCHYSTIDQEVQPRILEEVQP